MKFPRALALLSAFIAAPCLAAKPQIQWDPNYDFGTLETFQWSETPEVSIQSSDPFLHEHIINAIEFQLTSHGLREVDSDADVRVTYHMSIDSDVRLQSTSVGYGFGNYGMGSWGYYGYGMGGPVYTDTRVVEINRGTLMVDIWDDASNELIWRGQVQDISVSDNPEKFQRNVEKAIKKMAKQADKLRDRAED